LLKSRKALEKYLRGLLAKQLITYEMIDFLEIPENYVQKFVKMVKPRPGSVFSGLVAIQESDIEHPQALRLLSNESSSEEGKNRKAK
jgi:hypothetical protein